MVTCPKCGYEWPTKATAAWITCPGCQRKFPRPAPVVEVLGRKVPLSSPCTRCGIAHRDLNVCKVDGEPAFLCQHCTKDMTA